ncbi:MAG TPA: gluconokinase [Gemmatimonadaceae bacterium]
MSGGIYVVMGVAGSGKTVIGAALARGLGVEFVDGDDFHSTQNVERMAAGIPLTDADRSEWLEGLAGRIRQARDAGNGLVLACSALKRAYRNILRLAAPDLQFVFLDGASELIAERLSKRTGHYMPASLLDSQLATLERPSADEGVVIADISRSPREIVEILLTRASA